MADTRYQCSLQGAIIGSFYDKLLERLRGLCQPFETVYRIREVTLRTDASQGAPSELRARSDLETPNGGWSLHYIGGALKRDDLAALCKTCVDIEVGDNVAQFLETMGFNYEFEFVKEGVRLHALTDKIKIDIYIYKLKKFTEKGSVESAVEVDTLSSFWIVDAITYTDEPNLKMACEELNDFANRLVPIVDLLRLDDNTKRELDRKRTDKANKKKNQIQFKPITMNPGGPGTANTQSM
jgi:hypothetical protein